MNIQKFSSLPTICVCGCGRGRRLGGAEVGTRQDHSLTGCTNQAGTSLPPLGPLFWPIGANMSDRGLVNGENVWLVFVISDRIQRICATNRRRDDP